jgi:hypothetical protein
MQILGITMRRLAFFWVTVAVEVVVVVTEVTLSKIPSLHHQPNLLVLPSPSIKNPCPLPRASYAEMWYVLR